MPLRRLVFFIICQFLHGEIKAERKNKPKISLEEALTENSTYNTVRLKQRLIKANLLEAKCSECAIGEIWNNKKLVLQLDHINGIHSDNRLSNLRIICPNCHSQTENFAGRNVGRG